MKKTKIDWWLSGASYQANVAAWLAQGIADGGTPPTGAQLSALSTLMNTLSTQGLLSRFKTLNCLHLGSKEFAKLNLINPATFKYTESGTVTFSALNGCKSASSSYFNHGFKSDAFAGNALSFMLYVSESNAVSAIQSVHGVRTKSGTASFYVFNPLTSSQAQAQHNTTNTAIPANTNHKGFYVHTYTTTIVLYVNGSKATQVGTLQTADISNDRLVLAVNSSAVNGGVTAGSFYTRFLAWDGILDQVSDADEANLRTAFTTYNTAVGLP